MKKNYFYKFDSGEFLAAVIQVDESERSQWAINLALDLVKGCADAAKTDFAKDLIKEANSFRELKAEAGRRSAKKRWGSVVTESNTPITESNTPVTNSNSNSNSNSNNIKPLNPKSVNKYTDEDMKLAQWIFNLIAALDPDRKKPNFDSWANTLRLMREIDKLTHREIAEVFKWANSDTFWKINILSPSKLREKFSDLKIKMNHVSKPEHKTLSQQIDESREQRHGMDTGLDGEKSKIIDVTPVSVFTEDRYRLPGVN